MGDKGFAGRVIDRAGAELLRLAHDEEGMSTAEYSVEMFYTRGYCL